MRVNARTMLAAGLGCGCVLAGVVFWMYEGHDASHESAAISLDRFDDSAKQDNPEDMEALRTETERLKGSRNDVERLSAELSSLRSTLAKVSQDQASMAQSIDQASSREAPGEAATLELTPEEELERADAQTQAQFELIDGTLLAEESDSDWASSANLALHEAFQSEDMKGVALVGVECRTTICRLELSLDNSAYPEDSFYHLVHVTPWQGQKLFRINEENGEAVVYLAREGHSLPQLEE